MLYSIFFLNFCKFNFLLMLMRLCPWKPGEGVRLPESRVTGGCESPDASAENQTRVRWESSVWPHSWAVGRAFNCWAGFSAHSFSYVSSTAFEAYALCFPTYFTFFFHLETKQTHNNDDVYENNKTMRILLWTLGCLEKKKHCFFFRF